MMLSCVFKLLFIYFVFSRYQGFVLGLGVSNDSNEAETGTLLELYSKDKDNSKTKVIKIALNKNCSDFDFSFDSNFKCNLIKYQNDLLWEKEEDSEYPLSIYSNGDDIVKLFFKYHSIEFFKFMGRTLIYYGMAKNANSKVESSKTDVDSVSSSESASTPSHTTNKDIAKYHVDLVMKVAKLEEELRSLKYDYEYMRIKMEKVDSSVLDVVKVLSGH